MSATDISRGVDAADADTVSVASDTSVPSISQLEDSTAGEVLPAANVESAEETAGFGSDAFDEDTDEDSAGATIADADRQEAKFETADTQSFASVPGPESELSSIGHDLDDVLNSDEFDSDSSASSSNEEELSVGEADDGIFDSTDDDEEDGAGAVFTGQANPPPQSASAGTSDKEGDANDDDDDDDDGDDVLDTTGSSGSSSDSDSGVDDDEQLDILLEHIESQDLAEVKALLDIEGDDDLLLNMPDDNNETPLMHAIATGNLRLVKLLLDYKADVDYASEDGMNVLGTAIKHKNAQIGSLILQSMLHGGGGGPAAQAAHAAAQRGRWEARNPVFEAIRENAPDFIHLLAASKAAIHGPGARKDGYGLLGLATKLNHVDCVEKLLSLSADPDERIHDDNSVLHVACRQGFFDAADVILSYNADVNLRTKQGWTPAHFAALAGDLDIIDMLIEERADLNLQNLNGNTVRDIWNNMFPDTIGEYDECIQNAVATASSKTADGSESTDAKPATKAAPSTGRRRSSSGGGGGGGSVGKGDIKLKPSHEKSQPRPQSTSPRRTASVQIQQFSEADVVTRLRTFPASQISIKVPSATAPRDQLMGQPLFHLIVSCGIQCTWTKSLPFKDFRKLFMDLTQAHGRAMVAAAGIEPPRLVIGLGQTIIERQREVLATFSKSLLQFRSPRPDEIIQFLVPEDAMLNKMNNFLKMNAQVNTLKQNASILAGLTESSITDNIDEEEEVLPERSGAGVDPSTPPRRNGSENTRGGGDSAGNTPAVTRRHPGVVAAAKAEFHPAASPSGVLAESPPPGQELPPSIDVAIPISIREQVSVLTAAYGQGMWVWGFGRSTYGGIRLLPRRAEYPETFLGGMIGAATAIAVVRAVAGIGWRGEVNILGLRSKSTFFPVDDVATLAHLLVQFQEARKVAEQDQSPTRSSHVSVVVRPLLSQKNPFEGVLFDRKMTIHGYGSSSRPKSPKAAAQDTTQKTTNAGGFASMWGAKKANAESPEEEKRRRGLESTERAREYQNLFDNLTLEARQAILGLNFGKQASVGRKMKTYLKRFLACMREFALARHGGRYTDVEFKKKVTHFKNLAEAIDEELDDMQGYLDKALSQLKGTFAGGNFIDMTIATWNSVSQLRDMLSAGLLNLQQHSVS